MPTSLFWILKAISSDGTRSPESHRLTTAPDTPIATARSSCVQPNTFRRTRRRSDVLGGDSAMSELLPNGNSLSSGNTTNELSPYVAKWQRGGVAGKKTFRETLSALLKSHELKTGANQAEVARQLDVAPSTVSRWASGEREPSGIELCRLAKLLDVRPEALLGSDYTDPHPQAPPKRRGPRPKSERAATSFVMGLPPSGGASPKRRTGT